MSKIPVFVTQSDGTVEVVQVPEWPTDAEMQAYWGALPESVRDRLKVAAEVRLTARGEAITAEALAAEMYFDLVARQALDEERRREAESN